MKLNEISINISCYCCCFWIQLLTTSVWSVYGIRKQLHKYVRPRNTQTQTSTNSICRGRHSDIVSVLQAWDRILIMAEQYSDFIWLASAGLVSKAHLHKTCLNTVRKWVKTAVSGRWAHYSWKAQQAVGVMLEDEVDDFRIHESVNF